jgi:hypothetical protein
MERTGVAHFLEVVAVARGCGADASVHRCPTINCHRAELLGWIHPLERMRERSLWPRPGVIGQLSRKTRCIPSQHLLTPPI